MTADQTEPLFEVIDDLASADLYEAACKVCSGGGWAFGHNSNVGDTAVFWKMDLTGNPVFSAIWQQAKLRCEELAGAPLRIIRQYANGHTYGLGGRIHTDDRRPGSYTLLYYPMPEWKDEWEGETVFQDTSGDIGAAVRPRPNRAVFFDSRIPHAGRAPSRACHALRVTVAYKLEVASEHAATPAPAVSLTVLEAGGIRTVEAEREGTRRVYDVLVPGSHFDSLVEQRLKERSETVRLPGFRPGRIPAKVMEQRYGAATRAEIANRLAAAAADRIYAIGGLASAIETGSVPAVGDYAFRIVTTHLPDLPALDAGFALESLSASPSEMEAAGLTASAASEVFHEHLRQQVMDHLDSTYAFPVAPALVEKEFAVILRAAEAQLGADPQNAETRQEIAAELHVIAERRVRLGAVVAELARRFDIGLTELEVTAVQLTGETGERTRARLVENKVVERLVANARVSGREVLADELRELAES